MCKTEKFPGCCRCSRECSGSYGTGSPWHGLPAVYVADARISFLRRIYPGTACVSRSDIFKAMGIMTVPLLSRSRKNRRFLLYWNQWKYQEAQVWLWNIQKKN
ncbi:MAG: hypothetical protein K1W34_01635 [Lachnospiraceae bacterium]